MKTMFKSIFIWLLLATTLGGAGAVQAEELVSPRALLSQHFKASERVTFVQVSLSGQQRTRI